MGGPQAIPPQGAVFDDAVFDTALDYGLGQELVTEAATQTESPKVGMTAHNAAIGSSQRSMSQACKVISTKLHWLR
jgi:hypothetical protein